MINAKIRTYIPVFFRGVTMAFLRCVKASLQSYRLFFSANCYYLFNIVLTRAKSFFSMKALTKIIQTLHQTTNFFILFFQQWRAARHSPQLKGSGHKVRHVSCRRTPPPPKLNLPLIGVWVITHLPVSWTVVLGLNRVGSFLLQLLHSFVKDYSRQVSLYQN